MIKDEGGASRSHKTVTLSCDLAVGGGGIAGVCTAIAAARAGLRVVLVQDRPVLGGNASSEVRLWVLGATSHMGNNNRWAREGGIIDEILVENIFRNPEGNPILVDALLLEFVQREPNITLLLNTVIHDVEKADADSIRALRAFCSQNSTTYVVEAPLFCDSTGDGVIGFLAGAAFRMGAESAAEFGEGMAPDVNDYGELLGHSLYFYARDTGRPVRFVPPSFALDDISKIPRFRELSPRDHGCRLWWIEYGGRRDTVHESEEIKWELWKVIYGVWHYLKNSGQFPETETMTLEWVGMIPGKRESRRFEGDHMLTQQDIVEQRRHADVVSFGGWAIDLHPADGVFSGKSGCMQFHAKGVYGIPYRTLYSRNINNLFLGGRIISASHVAFGSSRVMATCGHNGGAIGLAAAACWRHGCGPRGLLAPERMAGLQRALLRSGYYVPGVALVDPEDLVACATVKASSTFRLSTLPAGGGVRELTTPWAMMLPVRAGPVPEVAFRLAATEDTTVHAELRVSSRTGNHTPDTILQKVAVPLAAGREHDVVLAFDQPCPVDGYAFYVIDANPLVQAALSERRVTGVLALTHSLNKAVAKTVVQTPPAGSGVDTFEFWLPERRPGGKNFAITVSPPIAGFEAENLRNGYARPVAQTNAWVAEPDDERPTLTIEWQSPQPVRRVELVFDTDHDHPMESVLMGHPETVMPFCVSKYRILDDHGRMLVAVEGNHQSRRVHLLDETVTTRRLVLELQHPSALVPAALFAVRAYCE